MTRIDAWAYQLCATGEPLERTELGIDQWADDEVVVKVAGCGLCHTDLGFISGAVRTKHALPLVLGHEISGTVVASGDRCQDLLGRNVIVPAVLPCGECDLCRAGRDNICQQQKMPGNDFHGGFSSHLVVPGRSLCCLPDDLNGFELSQLSVIADAVTTPYQSLLRSGLGAGDLAIVIGVGGIGLYMVQHAHNAGATVIALEIDPVKLETARSQGADHALCTEGMTEREVKQEVRSLIKQHGLPSNQWKIFESSGSSAGQATAFALLTFASTLGVIGFTMDKLNLRLSNVMAFDAELFGNWGCSPSHYPAVVEQVLDHRIELLQNIEQHPLDDINDVIAQAQAHRLEKRAVLIPGD
jgi:6-hydroxycyclohex-1-ene-1-carbonyl-CoA dehydrogenase